MTETALLKALEDCYKLLAGIRRGTESCIGPMPACMKEAEKVMMEAKRDAINKTRD